MSETPLSAQEEPDVGQEALAEALRAEHAAVYGYEHIGGAAEDEDRRERARDTAYNHKALRDALHAAAVERGLRPPPALTSYPLSEGRDADSVDSYAVGLEEATARAYLWLTASRDTDLRVTGARALQEATVRALKWGAALDALPGFDGAG
ncbi:ferritin-like domain-containing protein [Nocardiopsis sp. ATB16-24]|uniref:ferritin-like domain-containing protein n=1 Tax=Nocardiopsis sp. ATB16-24 TaxID=3019555 RepID=UPI002553461D|nr:ferritin-like domain-containing protein [Nocardiopsis sp. ATB16-24]